VAFALNQGEFGPPLIAYYVSVRSPAEHPGDLMTFSWFVSVDDHLIEPADPGTIQAS
jgi:hypothetical protein